MSDSPRQIVVSTADAEATRALGARLAALLRAGDLVLLTGGLGAGKTTLAQGIGAAMDVRGRVSSPTFIIARAHPALGDGPDLIHVDAYRLSSLEEVDALDLDSSMERSVTLVEWGRNKVEGLAEDRLEISVDRPHGGLPAPGDAADGAHGAADGAPSSAPDHPADPASPADPADPAARPVLDLDGVDDGRRAITIQAHGRRWADVDLGALVG
ncbi:tRNA (adenosine(37)-N6)-threonylcarbamoyltransferase complex ATPase subunit type 1 TsaE [Actinomyces marmotae]|uniref:tRNA threonylcarbamoyladenosine biosynthesis protein TsaE n=1 Tax=Actinomyces marmotae TaxID=2737173 RepID=A0A6M8B0M7_9ACTO|nr:tRNA (adenosine(37)-N6)-threonylcarbamoyltransferase complex ATPase subunit type 1 TsaE [Actinomyces marmotae]QKD79292.1 tRNA (adenosine(37)-N6)-threonylcarbamoyltransferase complex ATPase subunit type 1 TsaE [Actinomyces marmotae]